MKNFWRFCISVIGCELVGILSTPFTIGAINTWFVTLVKPPFSPPNWIFGPVWTVLYAMMGISFYLVWEKGREKRENRSARTFFMIQLLLNFMWSLLFFGLRSPSLAIFEIVILWMMIVLTMKKFYPISKLSFYLLVPYLIWVSFATLLNASFVILN